MFSRGGIENQKFYSLEWGQCSFLETLTAAPVSSWPGCPHCQHAQLSWLCSPWVMHLGPALHPPCTVSGYPIRILINSVIVCRAVVTGSKGSRRWEALGAQHRSHEWVKETRARVEQRARGRVWAEVLVELQARWHILNSYYSALTIPQGWHASSTAAMGGEGQNSPPALVQFHHSRSSKPCRLTLCLSILSWAFPGCSVLHYLCPWTSLCGSHSKIDTSAVIVLAVLTKPVWPNS